MDSFREISRKLFKKSIRVTFRKFSRYFFKNKSEDSSINFSKGFNTNSSTDSKKKSFGDDFKFCPGIYSAIYPGILSEILLEDPLEISRDIVRTNSRNYKNLPNYYL